MVRVVMLWGAPYLLKAQSVHEQDIWENKNFLHFLPGKTQHFTILHDCTSHDSFWFLFEDLHGHRYSIQTQVHESPSTEFVLHTAGHTLKWISKVGREVNWIPYCPCS